MTITVAGIELRPLAIPASIDAADAADFITMTEVRNQVYREISGHDDNAMTPTELLPHYRPTPYEERLAWVVVDQGRIVGRAGLDLPTEEGSRVGYWLVELLREAQGRGLGSQAYALIEQTAREQGRTVLQSWAEHNETPGERLAAPTGFGSVPAEESAVRFFVKHGYTLEQVERCSALDLHGPFDTVERLLTSARETTADYRVVSWFAPTPDEYVDGYAGMKARMVTDAPAAGLEFDEEVWDAARVRRFEQSYLDGGTTLRVVAAQHIGTGELAAFSELTLKRDHTAATHQNDTLVLKEHRGHQLGLLVKCENLVAWREFAPRSPRVITYNAEENRPMLDINEAIGFVPVAYEGAWKKVLAE
ncbi:MAG: GNAT family N-acetyltransferase [Propionibacteriaceae bacterium]|nr:GNAT family N-acetyltransferase [Propionibacteriaceae bacterium]